MPNINEFEQESERYFNRIRGAQGTVQGDSTKLKKSSKTLAEESDELAERARQLKTTIVDTFGQFNDGVQGAQQFTKVATSAGNVVSSLLSKFGILGKVLGKAVEGVVAYGNKSAEQSDKLYETFQKLSSVGATSSDGMADVFKNLQRFGYGVEQLGEMTALLSQNAKYLAKFGGSVPAGVNKLSEISDSIIHSDIGAGLMKMGKTVDSINRYSADVMRQQVMMGNDRRDNLAFLTRETAEYAYQMDALARMTGMTREQQQKSIDEAFGDEAFNQQMAEWNKLASQHDSEAQQQIDKWREILASNLPESAKKELSRSMAGDYGMAQQAVLSMPDAVRLARDKNATAGDIINAARDGLKQTQSKMSGLAKYHSYNEVYGDIKEQREFLASLGDEDYDTIKSRAREQQVVTDNATNSQTRVRISQMNTRDALQAMVNLGVTPVTQAFTALAKSSAWLAKVPGAYVPELGTKSSQAIGGESATGGAMGASVKASGPNAISGIVETGAGYIVVKRPDGSVQKLTGTRNWRNNNPGNIEYGDFAKRMGAIGSDGRFAVFPSYESGRNAKEKLIFEGKKYTGLTLSQAIARYAPPGENDTGRYQRTVLSAVNGQDKPMSAYTPQERQAIMDAMQKVEGFRVGTVQTISGQTVVQTGEEFKGDKSGLTGKPVTGVDSKLVSALASAASEYKRLTGKSVTVTSAYRDPQKQAQLYDDYRSGRSPYPAAPPGHSKHSQGQAIDVNSSDASALESMGLLRKYGLSRPVTNDPVHIELAKYEKGGVASGPTAGYQVLLHGTEAVVPVSSKNSIRVDSRKPQSDFGPRTDLLKQTMSQLSEVLDLMKDNSNSLEKIHRYKRA